MKGSVTAVIVNYHGAGQVAEAARSILADEPTVQVVVVDNSESPDQARTLRQVLPATAELIVAPDNLGFGRACNLAIAHAPADCYWLVNPDARILPGCLAPLQRSLDEDPLLGAVAPLQFLDTGQQWLFSPAWLPTAINHWVRQRVVRAGRDRDRHDRAVRAETVRLWQSAVVARTLRQRALSGSNLLVRHACVDARLGLFDPAYFMYFEDSDLCMRLRRQGWRMAVVSQARALHLWALGSYKDDLMQHSRPVYQQRHFADSPWLARACEANDGVGRPEDRWPRWTGGEWALPAAWNEGWSLEISPTPLFSPCIGRLGAGRAVAWPTPVIEAMPGVPLYVRAGPTQAVTGQADPPFMRVIRP